jgi:2-polyprenyl-3-methyl-5-hydroxy-6-metoxy-1,4-benzoquinol methylase
MPGTRAPQECLAKGNAILSSFKGKEKLWLKKIEAITNGGDAYIKEHAIRFAELLHTISELNQETSFASVLDCGHRHSGLLISSCYDNTFELYNVNIEDASEASSYLADHYQIDLERDDLDLVELGHSFDLITFAEVLEHLRSNPVKVLRFLRNHLNERGRIILTTPNFFNHHNLSRFRLRHSMQPAVPYNLCHANLHFHHVHEYCAHEVFEAATTAHLKLEAFWFSDCWDRDITERIPIESRSNMVFIFKHP